jgi:hypothetical protein
MSGKLFSRERDLRAQLFGFCCFFCLGMATAAPGEEPAEAAASRLFTSHEVLDLRLPADFDAMCRPNEVEGCQYTPTTMTYTEASGKEHSLPVEIRVRGGWRARKKHCKVPPLFVRFSPEETRGTPFSGQGLLPLTTHCRSKKNLQMGAASGKEYEQYVLREYLGYRLYNVLTDMSLRVRLVRIGYADLDNPDRVTTRYAFFTEHFDQLAARQTAQRLPRKSFDHEKIDLAAFDRVAMFNFMIGNTDFSVVRERNILLLLGEDGRQYPVPYDLDMAGLVNAEYAGVSPRLDFRDVRRRYYLGFCHPGVDFESLYTGFLEKETPMIALLADIPGINRPTRKTTLPYLKKFFKILETPDRRQDKIAGACHPWPPAPEDHTTPPDAT